MKTAQQLKSLTVANLLSPELGNRSSSRLPSAPLLARRTPSPTQSSAASSSRAAHPATGSTNSVTHPSIRCRGCCQKRRPPKNRPKSTPDHDSVAAAVSHKHHSIIRVGAGLLQFVHACTCTSIVYIKNPFWPLFWREFFVNMDVMYVGRYI